MITSATFERERVELEQLRESIRRARQKYELAAAGLEEINADLAQISARITLLEVTNGPLTTSPGDGGRQACGCRPAGTLDGAGGIQGYRDPGQECHPCWRARVNAERGWST